MKPVKKKDLVVTGQSLRFSQTPQVDAEGQVAVQRFETKAGVGYGATNSGGLGELPATIEYKTPAGQLANAVKTACAGCRHFDVKSWHRYHAAATGPASKVEDRQTIQAMRSRIMMAGYGVMMEDKDEVDLDATMAQHGICRVLSDVVEGWVKKDPMHWPVICWRESTCPTYVAAGAHRMEITTPAQPLGLFKPLDLDAQKIGAKRYDAVLHGAERK